MSRLAAMTQLAHKPERLRQLVIVPAFNESASISPLVTELRQQLPEVDVLVVDDGSTDATAYRVPLDAKVVSLPFNLGIGGAMQTGYRYAAIHGYDVAVQVDGDGQHPPQQVQRLVEHLRRSGADMVIGSRFLEQGDYHPSLPRMIGIRWLGALLRLLTGRRFSDCTSGFRVANQRVIRAFAHWYPEDYPEPEVILLLYRAGYHIEEIPIQMKPRTSGQSSIPLLRGLFYVVKVTVSLLLDMMRHPWPKDKVNLS